MYIVANNYYYNISCVYNFVSPGLLYSELWML